MIQTLKERIQDYEALADIKLMRGLPIIIILNGRSFKKTTSLLQKPFFSGFLDIMSGVIIRLMQEVDGSFFAYSFNDEIVLVVRNSQSQQAWYDNRAQKIASAAASIASCEFNRMARDNKYNILGDPIFVANIFAVPDLIEAINVLIAKQQQAFHKALYNACFYELLKKQNIDTIKESINEKTASEKAEILFEQCGIEYNDYDLPFRRGIACFRAPKVIKTNNGDEIRNKIVIETELPIFSKEPEYLDNIFRTGKDIIRERI